MFSLHKATNSVDGQRGPMISLQSLLGSSQFLTSPPAHQEFLPQAYQNLYPQPQPQPQLQPNQNFYLAQHQPFFPQPTQEINLQQYHRELYNSTNQPFASQIQPIFCPQNDLENKEPTRQEHHTHHNQENLPPPSKLPFSEDIEFIKSKLNETVLRQLLKKPEIICELPERLGFYSVRVRRDGSDVYFPNKISLPYLKSNYSSFENINLLENLKQDHRRYRIPADNTRILQWVNDQRNPALFAKYNFIVTNDRILRSIMNSTYNNNTRWTIVAIRFGSTIYLFFQEHYADKRPYGSVTPCRIKKAFIDARFIFLVTHKPRESTSPHFIMNGYQDFFFTVNEMNIRSHKILYSCKIDCTLNEEEYEKPIDKMEFAMIKTRPYEWAVLQKETHQILKAISWWIGSFLSSSDTVICGEKNGAFKVRDITTIEAKSLQSIQGYCRWNARECINNLDNVLSYIQNAALKEKTVYRIEWTQAGPSRTSQISCLQSPNERYHDYFPFWFMKGMKLI